MKKIASLVVGMSMLLSLAPSSSQAWVGLALGNAPLFVVGAVVTALNGGFVVSCGYGPHGRCHQGFFVTGVGGLLGLVLLDSQGDAAFAKLSEQDAARVGALDLSKVAAYNDEIDEINAVRESIVRETVSRAERGETVKGAEVHALWLSAREQGLISAEAFEVLEAVSAEAARSVQVLEKR
jgi:hypothetical protein